MPVGVAAALLMIGLMTLTQHFIGFTDSSDDEFGESVPAAGKNRCATVLSGMADLAWIAKIVDVLRKMSFGSPVVVEAVFTEGAASEMAVARAEIIQPAAGVEEYWMSPFVIVYLLAEALELTLGFGEPYRGGDLETGSEKFSVLAEQLNFVLPDDGWQGLAMSAYSSKIVALQDAMRKLAELDHQLAYRAKDHAKRINDIRLGVGFLKDFAVIRHFCCPQDGDVMTVCFGAYATLLTFIFKISRKHGNRVSNLCDEYQRLSAEMFSLGPLVHAGIVEMAPDPDISAAAAWSGLPRASDVSGIPTAAPRLASTPVAGETVRSSVVSKVAESVSARQPVRAGVGPYFISGASEGNLVLWTS